MSRQRLLVIVALVCAALSPFISGLPLLVIAVILLCAAMLV